MSVAESIWRVAEAIYEQHCAQRQSVILFSLTALSSMLVLSSSRRRCLSLGRKLIRLAVKAKKRKKNGSVNIGAIFGMDVGGTLAKIVYFQPGPKPSLPDSNPALNPTGTAPTVIRRQSSQSLAQLASPDHQAALQELYTYMDTTSADKQSAVTRDDQLTLYSEYLEGSLHFIHFETRNMVGAINKLSAASVTDHIKTIGCTGGGAHKYSSIIHDQLDISLNKHDELGCLVRGMMFALLNFPDECYTYRNADEVDALNNPPAKLDDRTTSDATSSAASASASNDQDNVPVSVKRWQRDQKDYTKRVILSIPTVRNALPFLVVNIGSGVSILKVSGPGQFERVSGTSLGGGTYWGLCRLLTSCKTFDDVLDLAENGDAGTIDMLVRDIYGGDYGNMLSGSMVASSFGKLVMKEDPRDGVKEEDLALALLMMITNNIGQVAHLCAQLHHCSKIFFVGSFLRHNPISCRRLSFAIDFWSSGTTEALFLAHEGYFGALGSFLYSAFGEQADRILAETQRQQERAKKVSGSPAKKSPSFDFLKRGPSDSNVNNNRNSNSSSSANDATSPGGNTGTPRGNRGRSSSDDYYWRQAVQQSSKQ